MCVLLRAPNGQFILELLFDLLDVDFVVILRGVVLLVGGFEGRQLLGPGLLLSRRLFPLDLLLDLLRAPKLCVDVFVVVGELAQEDLDALGVFRA